MNFIGVLNEELVKAGGHPAMIYFAQASHARPMMALLAKTIVESKLWKVPRSAIMLEIEQGQKDLEYLGFDKKWSWTAFSKLADDLTTIRFAKGENSGGSPNQPLGIPNDLIAQMEKSSDEEEVCVLKWQGKSYVVTHWFSYEFLHLAPAEYFDLDN
jgi:hypothetical protein